MSGRALRSAPLVPDDATLPAATAGLGFSCRNCGSPAVVLPRDLSAEALVICDHCQRPVATLAAFRAYVDRLAASAECCDHHLTTCRSEVSKASPSTG
ncbi:MAG: hypothetical protein EOP23_16620 [Hyphomicrobiales bacterium]|nr:MAG: hypothetical protein EOP23_16620 [Hyphomicrobiales bacterium]